MLVLLAASFAEKPGAPAPKRGSLPIVTIFYDSFYWAQIDLLLGAMAGVLSVRMAGIGRPARTRRRRMLARLPRIRWAT